LVTLCYDIFISSPFEFRTARNEFGWTDGQCDYVTQVLDSRFKDSSHIPLSRANSGSGLENVIHGLRKILDEINKAEGIQDGKELGEIHKIVENIEYETEKIADQKGLLIVTRPQHRQKKISTPEPEPGESNMHFKMVKLSETLSKLTTNSYDLADKIKQYPPTDPLFDRKISVRLTNLIILFINLGEYIRSLADEKYSFSLIEWTGINVNNERDSKGSAASKAGITPKNITKRQEKNDKNTEVFLDSIKDMEHLLRRIILQLSEWCDEKSKMRDKIEKRKDNLSPKLSEAAVRYGGGEGTLDTNSLIFVLKLLS
jgi:hypothetical protein